MKRGSEPAVSYFVVYFYDTAEVNIDTAEVNILKELEASSAVLTLQQIESIIKTEVQKTIENKASSQPNSSIEFEVMTGKTENEAKTENEWGQSNSGIEFEVMTGKLNVTASRNVSGVKLTGGEVNIYKVSAILAGGVFACTALEKPDFIECVKAVFATVRSVVANVIAKEIESASGSKDQQVVTPPLGRLIPLAQVRLYVVGAVREAGGRFCEDCLA